MMSYICNIVVIASNPGKLSSCYLGLYSVTKLVFYFLFFQLVKLHESAIKISTLKINSYVEGLLPSHYKSEGVLNKNQ